MLFTQPRHPFFSTGNFVLFRSVLILLAGILPWFGMTGNAQIPGSLDTSFVAKVGVNGGTVSVITPYQNGKVVIGGNFQSVNQRSTAAIAILNQDGSVDPAFSVADGPNNAPLAIAVQADGKILVAGDFQKFNRVSVPGLVRLNADGSVDTSFVPAINPVLTCRRVAVQADGNILVATNGFTLSRLRPNGSIDPVFNNGTPLQASVAEVVPLANGQILVAGGFPDTTTPTFHEVRRLFANGSRDSTFTALTDGAIVSMIVQPDSQIFLAGTFASVNNVFRNGLARLSPFGSLDTTFSSPLTGGEFEVYNSARSSDGTYYIVGKKLTAASGTAKIIRLTFDGSYFVSLNPIPEPTPTTQFYRSVYVQPDQGVLLGGDFNTVNGSSVPGGVLRLTSNSVIDTSFAPAGGAQTTGNVQALAVQPDAKIVFGGQFNTVLGKTYVGLTRATLDGQIDPTFTQGSGFGLATTQNPPPVMSIYDIGVQSNGGILVAGLFTSYNGVSRNGFVRLNDTGNVDASFNPTVNGSILAFAIQSDDKILIYGTFTTVNGTARNGIARLNADGTLDQSFTPTGVIPTSVRRVVIQRDGKCLLVGATITRLNANGTPDTGFSAPVPDQTATDAFVLPDFRILVIGKFQRLNSFNSPSAARLNPDGSFDPTFFSTVVSQQMEQPNRIAVQPDGQIVIVGNPARVTTGSLGTGLVRLNPDGTVDPTFSTGTGFRLTAQVEAPLTPAFPLQVNAVQVLPSQGLLCGGSFELYNGQASRGLARIEAGALCQYSLSPSSAFFPQAGGAGSVTLTVTGGCAWQAFGVPSWITGFPTSGTGTQTITFNVAPNPGTMRRAFISIGGQPFTVVQGDACSFTLNPTAANFNYQAATGTLTITASSPDCQWTALNLPDWITGIPFSGQGTQTFTYSVNTNSGFTRSAAINIGGQTITITQMANPCPFQVSPLEFSSTGKFLLKTITVTANPGCTWKAVSSVTWIGIIGSANRTGSGTVTLAISANPLDGPTDRRIGAVSVAGQTIVITQRPGRRRTTIGVQRPSNSKFYLRYSPTTGFAEKEFIYGTGNDIALSGDWDGNGTDSVGVYRNGTFFLRNSNSAGTADLAFPYGVPGDIAVTGDWDGDGIDTVGVFRNGVFYLRNSNTPGPADIQVFYGQTGDKPVVGDWNGDGVDTVGIFRAGVFYLRNSNTNGFADIQVSFGLATDLPIVGDWDGDGTDTIGVYRNGEYYMRNFNTTGPFSILAYYGTSADVPIKGDWIHQ